jgi:hypothetical protein
MGFDASYHPIDPKTVARVTEYIAGRGSIDDLVVDAVRHAKVRFRANAWSLGVTKVKTPPPAFNTSLHVWGRPFFIAALGAAPIAEMIDRYLGAKTDAQTDKIAKENLAAIDRALLERVKPSNSGRLPKDDALAKGFRANIDLLRAACAAAKDKNGTVMLPNGESSNAAELLVREVPLQVLMFCSANRPGWMDRGKVWPTLLLEKAKVPKRKLFGPPTMLLGALAKTKRKWFLHPTIVENYMVGGCVAARDVPALSKLLATSQGKLERAWSDGDEADDEMKTSVKKLLEAVEDAKLRGLPFAEATECYSGFAGIMN